MSNNSLSKIALALEINPYSDETEILSAIAKLKHKKLLNADNQSFGIGSRLILSDNMQNINELDWDSLQRKNPEYLEKLKKESFAQFASLYKTKFGKYPRKD